MVYLLCYQPAGGFSDILTLPATGLTIIYMRLLLFCKVTVPPEVGTPEAEKPQTGNKLSFFVNVVLPMKVIPDLR